MTAAALPGRVAAGIVLPGVPESVRRARATVRRSLGGHPAAEAAALAVSELAARAIAYTRSGLPGGRFAVTLEAVPGAVLIRVHDQGARGRPDLAGRPAGEPGRGLHIVAALATRWGTEWSVGGGRVTWCRIETPQVPAPGQGLRS